MDPSPEVVEFEDLLRPNEAMALLEAARVTAERRLGVAETVWFRRSC